MELRGKKTYSNFVLMEFLANRYNWTFTEIKKLTTDEISALLLIIKIRNKLEEKQIRK
jgi:hypothetical protein